MSDEWEDLMNESHCEIDFDLEPEEDDIYDANDTEEVKECDANDTEEDKECDAIDTEEDKECDANDTEEKKKCDLEVQAEGVKEENHKMSYLEEVEQILLSLSDDDKPWKKDPSLMSKHFNFGFSESAWLKYSEKKRARANESKPQAVESETVKMQNETSAGEIPITQSSVSMPGQVVHGLPVPFQAYNGQFVLAGNTVYCLTPAGYVPCVVAGVSHASQTGGDDSAGERSVESANSRSQEGAASVLAGIPTSARENGSQVEGERHRNERRISPEERRGDFRRGSELNNDRHRHMDKHHDEDVRAERHDGHRRHRRYRENHAGRKEYQGRPMEYHDKPREYHDRPRDYGDRSKNLGRDKRFDQESRRPTNRRDSNPRSRLSLERPAYNRDLDKDHYWHDRGQRPHSNIIDYNNHNNIIDYNNHNIIDYKNHNNIIDYNNHNNHNNYNINSNNRKRFRDSPSIQRSDTKRRRY